jgi:hypothetical protein
VLRELRPIKTIAVLISIPLKLIHLTGVPEYAIMN